MKKQGIVLSLVLGLITVFYGYALAWENPGLLMTPDDVEKVIGKTDWVILDCRDKNDYEREHI